MHTWGEVIRDGVRLAYRDSGGDGPPLILLHGLAGHADEWAGTMAWLAPHYRVVAADGRGHGRSERHPADVSREALVADAAFLIEVLGLGPAGVIGQSLGGLVSVSLAARRPELVQALVVVEASPTGGVDEAEEAAEAMRTALMQWPVPFRSRADARKFFVARFGTLAADAWTSGLEERGGQWWPRFEIGVMVQMLREAVAKPSWSEWEKITCPTLLVVAGNGVVGHEATKEMIERLPAAQLVELPDAGHDLHLDHPGEWRQALTAFLDSLGLWSV
jgi:pimeloyl-ACP methyl ester carboxylesterase